MNRLSFNCGTMLLSWAACKTESVQPCTSLSGCDILRKFHSRFPIAMEAHRPAQYSSSGMEPESRWLHCQSHFLLYRELYSRLGECHGPRSPDLPVSVSALRFWLFRGPHG